MHELLFIIPLVFIYLELRDCAKHLRKIILNQDELVKIEKYKLNNP